MVTPILLIGTGNCSFVSMLIYIYTCTCTTNANKNARITESVATHERLKISKNGSIPEKPLGKPNILHSNSSILVLLMCSGTNGGS